MENLIRYFYWRYSNIQSENNYTLGNIFLQIDILTQGTSLLNEFLYLIIGIIIAVNVILPFNIFSGKDFFMVILLILSYSFYVISLCIYGMIAKLILEGIYFIFGIYAYNINSSSLKKTESLINEAQRSNNGNLVQLTLLKEKLMKGYRFKYCSLGFMLLMMLRGILEITLQSASIFIFHVYAQVVYGIYILILNALAQNNKVEIYIRRPMGIIKQRQQREVNATMTQVSIFQSEVKSVFTVK